MLKTNFQKVTIHCKRCDFKGEVDATRRYYVDCPECDKLVYVGYLIAKEDN